MLFEVNVEPLAVRGAGASGCGCHQFGSDAGLAQVLGDHRVENEGMGAAIPGDVDEPHQPVGPSRADPAEAVTMHSCVPVGGVLAVAERLRVKRVDGCVIEVAALLICDRHGRIVDRRVSGLSPLSGPCRCSSALSRVRQEGYSQGNGAGPLEAAGLFALAAQERQGEVESFDLTSFPLFPNPRSHIASALSDGSWDRST